MATLAELRKKVEDVNQKLISGGFSGKKTGGKDREEDPRFWYPALDEHKMGYGVFRFLPPSPGSSVPWSQIYFHQFKTPTGQWYVENCPTTFGGKCPVCSANKVLWDEGSDKGKSAARDRKRKLKYFFNILVLQDPANPENNGKNKIFKSGPKIFEMTQAAMKPQFPGETALDAFDPWTGAPFELKIREYEGNVNYDLSAFMRGRQGPLGDDTFIEKIWNQQFDLAEFGNPAMIKTYDELEAIFKQKNGENENAERPTQSAPAPTPKAADPAPQRQEAPKAATSNVASPGNEPDPMSFFTEMAE